MTGPDVIRPEVTGPVLRIISPGIASTVQDLGRPGWFAAGVGVSGAADRPALILANRLVGNDHGAATIETVLGGLVVTISAPAMVAVTGAPAPADIDGVPVPHQSAVVLQPGRRLRLSMARAGVRSYLAVSGGIAVAPVLGSRSRDTLAGLGPAPLAKGDELPIGAEPLDASRQANQLPLKYPLALTAEPISVTVRLGPRDDWFTDPRELFAGWWVVSTEADRVGVRLDRPAGHPTLVRRDARELRTEGMPSGAIQVPPDGRPVVFLADHPITGGYPVIGTVLAADVSRVAQARPGQHLLFVEEQGP